MSTTRTSPPSSTKRLLHELQSYTSDPNPALLHLAPVSESQILHWDAIMKGVDGSAYEGKPSILPASHISPGKPLCSPRTLTDTWTAQTGEICLDLLKQAWTPAYTITQTLTSIHQLLTYPEPDSPLNVDLAALLRAGDLVGAESLVRYCTREFRAEG